MTPSPSVAAASSATAASPSATATLTPTWTPVPAPTPTPIAGPAWTTVAVGLTDRAAGASVSVHLGKAFPLTLTGNSSEAGGVPWFEAAWKTPARTGTGWLPGSALTRTKPDSIAEAQFDALDPDLAKYLASLGTRIGVEVLDVSRGTIYAYNADRSYFCASSVKVPIMLAFLSQLEAKHREPTSSERRLLATMIENSNNHSAEQLYERIGAQKGLNAFTRAIELKGLVPNKPGWWGHSTITPAAMVRLLQMLHQGTILNEAHRKLALTYMTHVDSHGRVGLGDNSPAGAKVAMKDGWTAALDGSRTYVVNTSGIVTVGGETYIAAIYTNRDRSYGDGWKIVRHVSSILGRRLAPKAG